MFAGSGHEAEVMGGSIKRPVHIVQLSCLVVASIFFGPRHCSSTSATNWTQPTTRHRARNKSHTCDQLEKGFQVAGKSRARTRAAGGRQSACCVCVREKCGARQRSVKELGHPGLKRDVYNLRPSNRAIIEVSNESSIFFAPQISAKTTLGHGARASRFQNERSTFLGPRLNPSSKSQMSAQLPSPPQISAKTTLHHGARASRFQNERSIFLVPRLDPSSRSQMSAQLSSPFPNLRKNKAQWRH
jgi:hypothetical protein